MLATSQSNQEPLLEKPKEAPQNNTIKALLYMTMGSLSMGLMNFIAKLIREYTKVTALQTSLFRAFGMTFYSYAWSLFRKVQPLEVPREISEIFVARCAFGYFSITAMFLGIFMLPFAIAQVLYFTQPVSAAVINFIFGGESLNWYEYVTILFSMLGVVIMTNPTLVFWWTDGERGFDTDDYPYFTLGVAISLLGSISSGFAYLMMRKMGKVMNPHLTPLYFGLFCIYFSMLMNWVFGQALEEPLNALALGLLTVMSLLGWIAQVGVTNALFHDKAGRCAALNYLQVAMAWAFDVLIFGAVVKWTDVIGTLFIVGFTFAGALYKSFAPQTGK